MRSLCYGLVLAVLFLSGARADDGVVGHYLCSGIDLDGTPYTGSVDIVAVADAYSVFWTIGGARTFGVGLRDKDTLGVAYATADSSLALSVYHIKGKQLIGRWIVPGSGAGVLTETLLKVGPVVFPGPAESAPPARSLPPGHPHVPGLGA